MSSLAASTHWRKYDHIYAREYTLIAVIIDLIVYDVAISVTTYILLYEGWRTFAGQERSHLPPCFFLYFSPFRHSAFSKAFFCRHALLCVRTYVRTHVRTDGRSVCTTRIIPRPFTFRGFYCQKLKPVSGVSLSKNKWILFCSRPWFPTPTRDGGFVVYNRWYIMDDLSVV